MKLARPHRLDLLVRRTIVGAVAVGSTAITLVPGGYITDMASAMGTNPRPAYAGAVESMWPDSGEAPDVVPSGMAMAVDDGMAPTMPAHSTNP